MVRPSHACSHGSYIIKKNALGHHHNDIMIVTIYPRTHHSTITKCKGQYLYVILNGKTIDLTSIIYRTIIFHIASPASSFLHYPFLISCGAIIYSPILISLCRIVLLFKACTFFIVKIHNILPLSFLLLRILLSPLIVLLLIFLLFLLLLLLFAQHVSHFSTLCQGISSHLFELGSFFWEFLDI